MHEWHKQHRITRQRVCWKLDWAGPVRGRQGGDFVAQHHGSRAWRNYKYNGLVSAAHHNSRTIGKAEQELHYLVRGWFFKAAYFDRDIVLYLDL